MLSMGINHFKQGIAVYDDDSLGGGLTSESLCHAARGFRAFLFSSLLSKLKASETKRPGTSCQAF
jgi:hypothetical protein